MPPRAREALSPRSGVSGDGGGAQSEQSAEMRGDREGPPPSWGSVHWDPVRVGDSE